MIKSCVVCGHSFKAKTSNAKYCSDNCRRYAKNLRSREQRKSERITYHKTCAVCGSSFETFTNNKLYCSKECKRLASLERRRIRDRNRPRPKRLTVIKKESVIDLCSICGNENIEVEVCPVCGFLVCAICRDSSGICKICSSE